MNGMDGQELERMFSEYGDDVHHFLVYYKGTHDVEDDVQEVFIKAFKSRFREESHPKTWLISIARRLVIDQWRRKKLLAWLPGQRDIKTPDEILVEHEELSEAYKAISELKAEYRDVIMLRMVSELSVEETAHVLGWPRKKVSRTYYRALQKLKQNPRLERGAELEL
ncbi:RNA polymerase sigma-70 factor (ECF subfamily) [Metabacillus sp. SLBN-84]